MTEYHLLPVQPDVSISFSPCMAQNAYLAPVSARKFISLGIGSNRTVTGNSGRKYFGAELL